MLSLQTHHVMRKQTAKGRTALLSAAFAVLLLIVASACHTARPSLKSLAEAGDTDAQMRLACIALYSDFKNPDTETGMYWLTKAVDGGNADAINLLAYKYQEGAGVTQNLPEAVRLYTLAADMGDIDAPAQLGSFYQLGYGVEQNDELSFKWFLQAAQGGEPNAQGTVAAMSLSGTGTPRNLVQAVAWAACVAARDDVTVAGLLGEGVLNARSVREMTPEQLRKALLLAEQYAGASRIEELDPTAIVFNSGIQPLRQQAASGNATATYLLAVEYTEDMGGAPEEYGLQWMERAAAAGEHKAFYQLGRMYLHGRYAPENTAKGLSLLSLAAGYKMPDAIYELGLAYKSGRGTTPDDQKGFTLIRQAAESGHRRAQLSLVQLYLHGIGTDSDPVSAYAWAKVVTDSRFGTGKRFVARLAKESIAPLLNDEQLAQAEELAKKYRMKNLNP
ncbi:tetratricopeptide repeat protein [Oleidesulfovibrio sp.]|uniref:tetratricopeptide repeat protein n=1 Tax=Oleidesulfovibrio sp. TaxID=2909707 RepID=UPI003A85C334